MKGSVHPTLKRLVATQAVRTTTPCAAPMATRAIPQLHKIIHNNNESTTTTTTKLSSRASLSAEPQHHQRHNPNHKNQSTIATAHQTSTDYYDTSSFETALNQVLRLERDSASTNADSHHGSMETCLRDFFRV